MLALEVKDFELLAVFEKKAVGIMRSYGGNLVRASETIRKKAIDSMVVVISGVLKEYT